MLNIYIDESGNLGKQGRYFVIAAFVTENGKRIKNILKRYCADRGLVEIKGRKLTMPDRQNILNSICDQNDHYVSYICLDKLTIRNRKLFEDKNILFNYLVALLIEPIFKRNLTDICLYIDNRSPKLNSSRSLPDYIKIKAYGDWNFEREIFVHYADSRKLRLIQAADMAAGIILEKYRLSTDHFYRQLTIVDRIVYD